MVTVYSHGHITVMSREVALDYAADCYINQIECRIMYGIETLLWIKF